MIRTMWRHGIPGLLLLACTPLGFWLYEDPVVTVSRVTLEVKKTRHMGGSPVVVALAVENRNDYALSSERVEVFLRLDGIPIGKLKRDSTVPVEMAAVSTLPLALRLEKQATPEHLATLGSGTHTFAVRGRATFRTPFGMRKVRFEQEGAMTFGERPTLTP